MLIRVRYHDNSDGTVDASKLDRLISTGEIVAFKRASGWVRPEHDRVRSHVRSERRRPQSLVNLYV